MTTLEQIRRLSELRCAMLACMAKTSMGKKAAGVKPTKRKTSTPASRARKPAK